ncbi:hypothetical protein Ct61P_08955 [Colletotrichum tofieldiae]|nr:hypothetical protein Ct61P_08955 [Colletotrichum tofieldiae]
MIRLSQEHPAQENTDFIQTSPLYKKGRETVTSASSATLESKMDPQSLFARDLCFSELLKLLLDMG